VLRRGRSLDIKKKEIRDKPLKTSHLLVAYLNPINILCMVLFSSCYALFLYCYYPYIAIVGDLAPQVELLSSMRMKPLLPIQQPYLRDLMASIKVIGKLISGAKNSRMGKLSEKF
jgi:hypothetical protein